MAPARLLEPQHSQAGEDTLCPGPAADIHVRDSRHSMARWSWAGPCHTSPLAAKRRWNPLLSCPLTSFATTGCHGIKHHGGAGRGTGHSSSTVYRCATILAPLALGLSYPTSPCKPPSTLRQGSWKKHLRDQGPYPPCRTPPGPLPAGRPAGTVTGCVPCAGRVLRPQLPSQGPQA